MQMIETTAGSDTRNSQKTRRQLSNADKNMHWNQPSGSGSASNSAQMASGQRKQGSGGGTLGTRKTSLEQKFPHSNFTAN